MEKVHRGCWMSAASSSFLLLCTRGNTTDYYNLKERKRHEEKEWRRHSLRCPAVIQKRTKADKNMEKAKTRMNQRWRRTNRRTFQYTPATTWLRPPKRRTDSTTVANLHVLHSQSADYLTKNRENHWPFRYCGVDPFLLLFSLPLCSAHWRCKQEKTARWWREKGVGLENKEKRQKEKENQAILESREKDKVESSAWWTEWEHTGGVRSIVCSLTPSSPFFTSYHAALASTRTSHSTRCWSIIAFKQRRMEHREEEKRGKRVKREMALCKTKVSVRKQNTTREIRKYVEKRRTLFSRRNEGDKVNDVNI